jgi:beta-lactamase class A
MTIPYKFLNSSNMPLYKAKGKGKKATQAAIAKNIKQLYADNASKPSGKKRKMNQIIAISESVARGRSKSKKKK